MSNITKCGYIGIIGMPNVGKSTLMNQLIEENISISSRMKHTTRSNLLGIRTDEDAQYLFLDTPGIFLKKKQKKHLQKVMLDSVYAILPEVDVLIILFDLNGYSVEMSEVLAELKSCDIPLIACINKVDQLKDKNQIFQKLSSISEVFNWNEIIPLSALKKKNIELLLSKIKNYLPNNPFIFEDDWITDSSENFICSEKIREKIVRHVGDELPVEIGVYIEKRVTLKNKIHLYAVIMVEKKSQKVIVIGKNGDKLSLIREVAQSDLSQFLNKKVFVHLWVRVEKNWMNNQEKISQMGYRL